MVPARPHPEAVDTAAGDHEATMGRARNGAAGGLAVVVEAADNDAVAFF